MHEYEELYIRWKRYRLKRKLLFLSLIVLATTLLSYLYLKTTKPTKLTKPKQNYTQDILLPSKEFEKKLSTTLPKKAYKKVKKHKQHKTKPLPKPKKEILLTQNTLDIESIKKEFEKNPQPSKALFIARYYYDKKQYKKSLLWSLKANELDKKSEESWLLFAKSLVKTGKRNKAIRLLQLYIRKSHSPQAKILLKDILTGAFR